MSTQKVTHKCALCGRRRQVPGGGVTLREPATFNVQTYGVGGQRVELEAGAVICWTHSEQFPVFVNVDQAAAAAKVRASAAVSS